MKSVALFLLRCLLQLLPLYLTMCQHSSFEVREAAAEGLFDVTSTLLMLHSRSAAPGGTHQAAQGEGAAAKGAVETSSGAVARSSGGGAAASTSGLTAGETTGGDLNSNRVGPGASTAASASGEPSAAGAALCDSAGGTTDSWPSGSVGPRDDVSPPLTPTGTTPSAFREQRASGAQPSVLENGEHSARHLIHSFDLNLNGSDGAAEESSPGDSATNDGGESALSDSRQAESSTASGQRISPCDGQRVPEELMQALFSFATDSVWKVRSACADSIPKWAACPQLMDDHRRRLTNMTLDLIHDPSSWVRRAAMEALGPLIGVLPPEQLPASLVRRWCLCMIDLRCLLGTCRRVAALMICPTVIC